MIFSRAVLFGFLLVLLVGTLPASAQDSTETQVDDEAFVLRGSNRALSFTLDDLRLDGLEGGIGLRWFIGQKTALRTTLSLAVESSEDVVAGQADAGRSAFGVGTSFLVEWHSKSFLHVSPYLASGFGARFDAFSETTEFDASNPIQRRRVKGTATDFSVSAGLGVEVYVARRVSISGEHLFIARVRTGTEERREFFQDATTTFVERDLRKFTFGIGTSSLIVSVFF